MQLPKLPRILPMRDAANSVGSGILLAPTAQYGSIDFAELFDDANKKKSPVLHLIQILHYELFFHDNFDIKE